MYEPKSRLSIYDFILNFFLVLRKTNLYTLSNTNK